MQPQGRVLEVELGFGITCVMTEKKKENYC